MYRVEDKYSCSERDMLLLESRMKAVMRPDPAAGGTSYRISSLYFDDPADSHWAESEDGVSYRKKYRIRGSNRGGRSKKEITEREKEHSNNDHDSVIIRTSYGMHDNRGCERNSCFK